MTKTSKPPIGALAEALVEAMPVLDPREQQLALALYRRLAAGKPVSPSGLARELGRDRAEIDQWLEGWPGVFRDDDGRVTSFWGLAVAETPHRFGVDGCRLFTWCAWDALFIPELINRTAEVESRSPTGGETVRLIVDPDRVRGVDPQATVVSMLSPAKAFDYRVITSFCHFVHFFPSSREAEAWVSENDGTFLLSLAEAHALGRLVNRKRFNATLASARNDREASP